MCNSDQIFVHAIWGKNRLTVDCTFGVALMKCKSNVPFRVSWYFILMMSPIHLITVKLKWAFQVKDSWFFSSDQLYKKIKGFLVFDCCMCLFSSSFIWTAFECAVTFSQAYLLSSLFAVFFWVWDCILISPCVKMAWKTCL